MKGRSDVPGPFLPSGKGPDFGASGENQGGKVWSRHLGLECNGVGIGELGGGQLVTAVAVEEMR